MLFMFLIIICFLELVFILEFKVEVLIWEMKVFVYFLIVVVKILL